MALSGSVREGRGGWDHLGPFDPHAAQPHLVMHVHFGCPLSPGATSLLSATGADSPSLPHLGEGTDKGLILQLPSHNPCFTSRSPSTDQSALRFPLRSLKVLSEGDMLLPAAPAMGRGLSAPQHSHLLLTTPPVGRPLTRSVHLWHGSAPSSCPPQCLGLQSSPAPR